MAKTNSELVTDLYQTFLQRKPVDAELTYYTQRLDWGLLTRAGVAYTIINASEYNSAAEEVTRLYMAAFKRIPDFDGLGFWLTVHRNGSTDAQIADIFTRSPEFESKYGPNVSTSDFLDLLYKNVMDRAADAGGKQYWTDLLNKGLTRGDVVNSFAQSPEFQAKSAGKVLTTLLYTSMAGRTPTDAELAAAPTERELLVSKVAEAAGTAGSALSVTYSNSVFSESLGNDGSISNTITLTLSGDTFKAATNASFGKISNVPAGLTASLTKVDNTTALLTLKGTAKDHGAINNVSNLTVTLDDSAFTTNKSSTISGAVKSDIKVSFVDLPLSETNGVLTAAGALSNTLAVDLSALKLSFGGAATSLVGGSLAKVKDIDFSELKPAPTSTTGTTTTTTTTTTKSVTIKGDAQVNIITAAGYATTIDGGLGPDVINCGTAKDTIVFASTPIWNGADTINGFTIGKGGDVLNFSAFLNKTGTTSIATVEILSGAMTPKTWASGDVLVAQGNSIDADAIANMFAANRAFAAPTKAAKMVMITCDIVGSANIWYILNQTDVTSITSDEVTLVGTLKDVNNLALTGFDAGNFA